MPRARAEKALRNGGGSAGRLSECPLNSHNRFSDVSSGAASLLLPCSRMTSLQELDLSRCSKITDAATEHLLSIPDLKKLWISETGLTTDAVTRLSSLRKLCLLDLGGLPVTDMAICSLQVLTQLEYLDLWGSKISNKGAAVLASFPNLSFLNLAWTDVTKLPNLPSLNCLNMSRCTIQSIFEGDDEVRAPLTKLLVTGAMFVDVREAFFYLDASQLSFLDISGSPIQDFCFLPNMDQLEHLDLSFSRMVDNLMELVANIGASLRDLNLSNTRVSSGGIAILARNVPNLEILSLSHTAVDDTALSYISIMPSLRTINLSNTSIKGYIYQAGHSPDRFLSLTALHNLDHLESLDLEDTQVRDEELHPLSVLRELSHLSLKSDFLSDVTLHTLSSLPKLKSLGFRGAVLTNAGLHSFQPPGMLQKLDLSECWLLSADAISAFCKNHPQLDVRHEHFQMSLVSQNMGDSPSPSRGQPLQSTLKGVKSLWTPNRLFHKVKFMDERIKYSRDELLELQFTPSRDPSPLGTGIVLPTMLLNE
ncbi:uncharacterized protein LOC131245143 isoform X2 [Magnolia sinica]|uniref:uncharacterized protein LOC131245143 isoform X2 n=1 Tax=Magnolia sinica TaxID=86752 RepID=UPI002659B035|nr:uncharacterized protein LOC131245143 isoform X2 [Magnolia sinica]